MPAYDDRQSWFASSFPGHQSLCVTQCCCGRTHFVSAVGHGDYDTGQLEHLQRLAAEQPDQYVEEAEFDHVDACYIDGREIVPDCPCGSHNRYCDFIESHADELAKYLRKYFEQRAKDAGYIVERANAAIAALKPESESPHA